MKTPIGMFSAKPQGGHLTHLFLESTMSDGRSFTTACGIHTMPGRIWQTGHFCWKLGRKDCPKCAKTVRSTMTTAGGRR